MEIEIVLKGPICSCDTQDLGWSINPQTMKIFCRLCGAVLYTEHSELAAGIVCETEYPEGLAVHTEIIKKLPNNEYITTVPSPDPIPFARDLGGTVEVLYKLDSNGKPIRA